MNLSLKPDVKEILTPMQSGICVHILEGSASYQQLFVNLYPCEPGRRPKRNVLKVHMHHLASKLKAHFYITLHKRPASSRNHHRAIEVYLTPEDTFKISEVDNV